MKKPAIPANENERLIALRALNILDSAADEKFDRITRIAKRVFETDVALVSVVDENRQWFKSAQGLDVSETPRDISFCGHAILGDDVFVIRDTLNDERFVDNPLVTEEPKIRFYAGCPLTSVEGYKLATLCIIDTRPREFSDDDIALLKDLAAIVEQDISALQLATQDELTQLSNLRGFYILSEHVLSLCRRTNLDAILMVFDLDSLKAINDRFGHVKGNEALEFFAACLRNTYRSSDVIARIGGDEFVVLTAGMPADSVAETCNRLLQQIEKGTEDAVHKQHLSFSVGTARLREDDKLKNLLARADKRMYENKNAKKRLSD